MEYKGGVIKTGNMIDMIMDHIVSIVGWGVDDEATNTGSFEIVGVSSLVATVLFADEMACSS